MPEENRGGFEKKEAVKKEKGTMSKYEYDVRKAQRDREARAEKLAAAEEERQRVEEITLKKVAAMAQKEKVSVPA